MVGKEGLEALAELAVENGFDGGFGEFFKIALFRRAELTLRLRRSR
jgi:hypothetical protein